MANGIQTTVAGNLTADPELAVLGSGASKLTFSIACERSWKNDKGEWENETSFVDCIAWRQMAEDAAGVLEKGLRVVATGRFEQRFWDNVDTGKKQSKWQFVVDEVAISTKVIESLVRKRRGDAEGSRPAAGGRQQQSGGAARAASAARRPAPSSNDEEW
jgi:single-strand DNA-binding protein